MNNSCSACSESEGEEEAVAGRPQPGPFQTPWAKNTFLLLATGLKMLTWIAKLIDVWRDYVKWSKNGLQDKLSLTHLRMFSLSLRMFVWAPWQFVVQCCLQFWKTLFTRVFIHDLIHPLILPLSILCILTAVETTPVPPHIEHFFPTGCKRAKKCGRASKAERKSMKIMCMVHMFFFCTIGGSRYSKVRKVANRHHRNPKSSGDIFKVPFWSKFLRGQSSDRSSGCPKSKYSKNIQRKMVKFATLKHEDNLLSRMSLNVSSFSGIMNSPHCDVQIL